MQQISSYGCTEPKNNTSVNALMQYARLFGHITHGALETVASSAGIFPLFVDPHEIRSLLNNFQQERRIIRLTPVVGASVHP